MDKCYNIGGCVVRITGHDSDMYTDSGKLEQFQIADCDCDWHVECSIVDVLPVPRGICIFDSIGKKVYQTEACSCSYIGSLGSSTEGAFVRMIRNGDHISIEVKRSYLRGFIPARTILNSLEVEHLIVSGGGLLLHSSYIAHAGGAILFTAPSGTGKSTQAALWEQLRGAEIINGDRSVVRIREGIAEAWGIPFSGSSGICKVRTLPIKAIVYLSQAPVTTIQELSGIRAFRLLWEGCSLQSWNREDVERCSATLMDVISKIPVFHLACTPDESAVIALEKTLRRLEKHDSEK